MPTHYDEDTIVHYPIGDSDCTYPNFLQNRWMKAGTHDHA